jgi:hypothetical protein
MGRTECVSQNVQREGGLGVSQFARCGWVVRRNNLYGIGDQVPRCEMLSHGQWARGHP